MTKAGLKKLMLDYLAFTKILELAKLLLSLFILMTFFSSDPILLSFTWLSHFY